MHYGLIRLLALLLALPSSATTAAQRTDIYMDIHTTYHNPHESNS